jgi:hypothetical protein
MPTAGRSPNIFDLQPQLLARQRPDLPDAGGAWIPLRQRLLAEHEVDLSIDPEGGLEWALTRSPTTPTSTATGSRGCVSGPMNISGPDVDALGKVAAFDEAIQDADVDPGPVHEVVPSTST